MESKSPGMFGSRGMGQNGAHNRARIRGQHAGALKPTALNLPVLKKSSESNVSRMNSPSRLASPSSLQRRHSFSPVERSKIHSTHDSSLQQPSLQGTTERTFTSLTATTSNKKACDSSGSQAATNVSSLGSSSKLKPIVPTPNLSTETNCKYPPVVSKIESFPLLSKNHKE